jgi:hypothetical protein
MHPRKRAWVEVFDRPGRSKPFARDQEAQKGPGYARTKTPLLFVVRRPVYFGSLRAVPCLTIELQRERIASVSAPTHDSPYEVGLAARCSRAPRRVWMAR